MLANANKQGEVMKLALTGNPNSGKTTMYNALTGSHEKVGNWAGVTVESKEHSIKHTYSNDKQLIVVDLPGAYSMSPFTSEESIASCYVKKQNPDVIINIVDATNLGRSLFFTTQLLELGIPMVVALNKTDVNAKKQTKINVKKLSQQLGCPVIETISTSHKGLKELVNTAVSLVGKSQVAPYVQPAINMFDRDQVEQADRARFDFVNKVVDSVETRKRRSDASFGDKLDKALSNKWIGLPVFAVVMFLVFGISQAWVGPWLADLFVGLLEKGQEAIANALNSDSIWSSILVDGVIGGLIAVVGFLPLVMIMYFLIALLEDCGYMARATVVLDPIFKKVGLSGKSVIPFVVGTGCAVPGVMACRTIRDERERRATAMLTPFMPCGAKLPVIALFAGAFFPGSTWVGVTMYFVGIAVILLGALLINAITGCKRKNYFIIELPDYKLPSLWGACKSMLARGWSYVVKAGTIILVCNFAIHIMQTFNWSFQVVDANESILHDVAQIFSYLFAPLTGSTDWQLSSAIITGFIAKENVVGTLAVTYNFTGAVDAASKMGLTSVAALSYLMFNLFSPPCFAAIGAMNAELKSKKWLIAGVAMQLGVGYVLSFLVMYFGTLITNGSYSSPWMIWLGWGIVAAVVATVIVLVTTKRKRAKDGAK